MGRIRDWLFPPLPTTADMTYSLPTPSGDVAQVANLPSAIAEAFGINVNTDSVTRAQAMSIPAVRRGRNVIAGTLGSAPLVCLRNGSNGHSERVTRPLTTRPDPNVTLSYTLTHTVEDLIFYPCSFWRVLSRGPDKLPSQAERIQPWRITINNETQKVMIEAGMPASLVVPMGAPPGAVASGWLSVTAPLVVDLQENGRMLGNSGIDRIMLPAGKHDIELVNEHVGYREMRTVQVSPGRTAAINVTLPKGTVSLNAIPWASVSIDGESIGDTPIGNFPLTVGPHEVVFRNAELGEQRRVITVTMRSPVRLSVDLTKK